MALISENRLPSVSSSGKIVVTRRSLIFLLGVVTGFVWLFPVFGPPGAASGPDAGNSIFRYLRLLLPPLIFVFVRAEVIFDLLTAFLVEMPRGRLRRDALRILCVTAALGLLPLFSGFLTGNSTFILSAVLPLTLSFVTLVGIILLEESLFEGWGLGITSAACLFLFLGMFTSHLEASSYFGRPRVLFGFVHPISAASAVLGTMIFFALIAEKRWGEWKAQNQRFWLAAFGLVSLSLLLAAQSRNLLISILVALISFGAARHSRRAFRFGLFALLLLLPIFSYIFVLFGSPDNPVWAYVNTLSSGRLSFFQTVLLANLDLSSGQNLFEAGNARLAALADYAGFAATDSVFLSVLINYGAFTFIAFIAMLLLSGYQLSESMHQAAPFGALCGVVIFFNLDAQGVTTSNLAIFIVFAYAVRAGILAHMREPRRV